MLATIISFTLRIAVITVFWAFVWNIIKPKTQLMRIFRAVLLLVGFLGILALLRIAGQ